MIKFREYSQRFLSHFFDIRVGEMRRAILMQLNIFLIISSLLVVKPTVNSLFLAKFGVDGLPKAFVLVAIVAGLITLLYARALNRFSLYRIIQVTLFSSVLTLIVFGLFLHFNIGESIVLYLFYLWVSIFAVLSASQFWVLANMVFNVREAKRLFGFIGAGAIAGGIFGGYLTSLLALVLGSEYLPFLGAFLLVGCLPITSYVWRKDVVGAPLPRKKIARSKTADKNPFQQIKASKHLSLLAGIIGVGVIVAKLVDYQFSDLASLYIRNPDDLTAFFGFWFSSFNLISLFLQLFITRRVVGTLGVGWSLFFLPGSIFLAALILFFLPELWVAILLKLADGSLKQSINKSAVELLILPISQEVKNQTKTFIDVFVDSVATGLSGLILIFVVSGLDFSTRAISLIIIGLLLIWAWLALKIRQEYIRTFKQRIVQFREEGKKRLPDLSQESVVGGLKKVLQKGAEKQILYVLQKIREASDDRFFEDVTPLLQHPSAAVKAAAIHYLYFIKKHSIPEIIEPLTRDVSQIVKIKAFEYLIEHKPLETVDLINRYLQEEDYRIGGAALVSLAYETRDNPAMMATFQLEKRLANYIESLKSIKDEEQLRFGKITILKVITQGYLSHFFHLIHTSFLDADKAVVKEAILAAGQIQTLDFAAPLIGLLAEKSLRRWASEALTKFGVSILPELARRMTDYQLDISIRRAIPGVIQEIGVQQSVDYLFGLLDYPDQVVRIEILSALNHLNQKFTQLKFPKKQILQSILSEAQLYSDTLAILYAQTKKHNQRLQLPEPPNALAVARHSLIQLLEGRLDRNLERIFRLLGLNYPPDDIFSIYQTIRGDEVELRDDALEFLDNLLEPSLKKVLIPLVETAMMDTLSETKIRQLKLKIPGEYDCFASLLAGKDTRILLAVLHIIRLLEDRKYVVLVQKACESKQEKVRLYAMETLALLSKIK